MVDIRVVSAPYASESWHETVAQMIRVPVSVLSSWLDYQRIYGQQAGYGFEDLSVTFMLGDRPIAVWPRAMVKDDSGSAFVTSLPGTLREPYTAEGLSAAEQKALSSAALSDLIETCRPARAVADLACHMGSHGELTPLGERVSRSFQSVGANVELVVDLSDGKPGAWRSVRRSYRSLISGMNRIASTRISTDPVDLPILKGLHRAAAGRTTRSEETWTSQARAMAAGDAFLVLVSSLAGGGEDIGGALIYHSAWQAEYAVGAYDRALQATNAPVGHLAQWAAIQYLCEHTEVKSYVLGRFSRLDEWRGKLGGINQFKSGFASRYVARPVFRICSD
jgi:hypothetical protein